MKKRERSDAFFEACEFHQAQQGKIYFLRDQEETAFHRSGLHRRRNDGTLRGKIRQAEGHRGISQFREPIRVNPSTQGNLSRNRYEQKGRRGRARGDQFNKDPKGAHPNLTECERASLAHVDPDVNLGAEEFYFPHRGECPTIDKYKQAQPGSGYPIKLPLGLKKLRSQDDPKIIRAYADILGSLMQPTDRPSVDPISTCMSSPHP